jgi:uncharacterized Zn finger protein
MNDRRQAFLDVLESLRMPAQFQLGRRLARTGAVRGLTITSSVGTANVTDADGATYRVKIAVRAFGETEWYRVERALAGQALYAAKLLAGEVPEGLEAVLGELGLSLLPESLGEVGLSCSCHGWQEPCAHVIATWYALADAFDRDPFTMLAWRGRSRDDLLERVRAPRTPATPPAAVEPVARDFWAAGPRSPRPPYVTTGQRRPDAVLDQLDPLGLTLGRFDVVELIRPAYEAPTEPPSL